MGKLIILYFRNNESYYISEIMSHTMFSIEICVWETSYGVATISRLHKTIGLFCRIKSLL